MTLKKIRKYLFSKPESTEELPFGPEALVFKVAGKMYALIAWEENPIYISMKCEPDRAVSLRNTYPAIKPAYHFNKIHWNMVYVDGTLTDDQITDLIDHSYNLVVKNLKKTDRDRILGSGVKKVRSKK